MGNAFSPCNVKYPYWVSFGGCEALYTKGAFFTPCQFGGRVFLYLDFQT